MEVFEEERARLNFDKKELFRLVWNSEEMVDFITDVSKGFAEDPVLRINHSFFDLPREQQIGFNLRRAARMLELSRENKFPQVSNMNIGLIADKSLSISAVGLHYGMFETVINIQNKKYLSLFE